jgi:glycosyltransferase involved in cell wall biosynthesis
VLVSTHVDQTTGYSKVAYNLLDQIRGIQNVKVYHFGFQRHPNRDTLRKAPEGVIQYDAAANEDPKEEGFGFNKINEYLEMVNPDIVMIYNDPLIIHRFLETMKYDREKSTFKLWIYVDQVYEGIALPLIETINKHADRVYCFTEKWAKIYKSYSEDYPEIKILEHAVDSTMFTNMTLNLRKRHKESLKLPVPDNGIIFLNANRNSGRKRLDLMVMGFVRLLKNNPDKVLFALFVTNLNAKSGAHYDVGRIYQEEIKIAGLDLDKYKNNLIMIDTAPPVSISDEMINQIYNIADIGMNMSDGEGYGLCQLEHLFTGAPQIVTDVGSYETFLKDDVSIRVPSSSRSYAAGTMPLGFIMPGFDVLDVTRAMQKMIDNLDKYKSAASDYKFKTWKEVCSGLREDISSLANK